MTETFRPSRSTTIDITAEDHLIAAAIHAGNRVDVLQVLGGPPATAAVISGFDSPRGVALHPDGSTLFVIDRRGFYRVDGAAGATAAGAALSVCAEPTALVLTPSGNRAFVGCLEGVVVEVDTAGPAVVGATALRGAAAAAGGPLPYNAAVMALALSNDGDGDDDNETLVVPLFYADPVSIAGPEDADVAGVGVVALLDVNRTILPEVRQRQHPTHVVVDGSVEVGDPVVTMI